MILIFVCEFMMIDSFFTVVPLVDLCIDAVFVRFQQQLIHSHLCYSMLVCYGDCLLSVAVVSMVASGGSVFFVWFVKTETQVLVMSCIFSGVTVIGWNVLDVLGVELFPTYLRWEYFFNFNTLHEDGS